MKQTSLQYKLISALLACFIYGSWAYYVNSGSINSESQWVDGLNSALAQGISSFFLTLSIVVAVTFLYQTIRVSGWLKVVIPSLITSIAVAAFLVTVHWWIGTRHILITILPSIIVASLFCLVTATKLKRLNLSVDQLSN
ncbi:hypothetical protein [Litoribrevibacter albus]|uniref:Uncharacterized protein n=1 Tax=Litoribrevibacter albus TaxID=1473156 RepID=A0AA37W5N7_9GAMM|nr:hypothetical protein [Litoribrevibacter albus]GLQ29533.1 hypothetical protein GCM10007876_00110 [Litoribrevibacter albus]